MDAALIVLIIFFTFKQEILFTDINTSPFKNSLVFKMGRKQHL